MALNQDEEQVHIVFKVASAATQVFTTSAIVSCALFPFGYMKNHWASAAATASFASVASQVLSPASLLANSTVIRNVIANNTLRGIAKTGSRNSTPAVHEFVENTSIEKESLVEKRKIAPKEEATTNELNDKHFGSFRTKMLASTLLGSIETAATIFFDNKGAFVKSSQLPEFHSMIHRIQFAKMGINTKLARNISSTAIFMIATSDLQTYAAQYFPEQTYGSTASNLGIIAGGILGGVSSNLFDVVNRAQILQADLQTFRAASAASVIKDQFKTYGYRFPFRGSALTSIQTVVAFKVIDIVNNAFIALENWEPIRALAQAPQNVPEVSTPQTVSAPTPNPQPTDNPTTSKLESFVRSTSVFFKPHIQLKATLSNQEKTPNKPHSKPNSKP